MLAQVGAEPVEFPSGNGAILGTRTVLAIVPRRAERLRIHSRYFNRSGARHPPPHPEEP